MWTEPRATFQGRYYQVTDAVCSPKPVQQPHPPVLLGGYAANVFKRVVAWGDGWMPVRVSEEQVRAGRATLDELAEAAGRDPSTIQLIVSNLQPDRDVIARYGEAGANRVTVALPPDAGAQGLAELERLAEQVL
jgi:alkanesulfonate monooxygenase SsuD/methylene tetrahydromethanopterin reductase-like flavin-dependent oxidoreductase (luciferase family)